MGSSAIEQLPDADFWEQLVRSGVPKDEATFRVRARRLILEQTPRHMPAVGREPVGHIAGSLLAAGQGLTGGFLDELSGLVSGLDYKHLTAIPGVTGGPLIVDPTKYENTRDAVREADARYGEAHPVAHFLA